MQYYSIYQDSSVDEGSRTIFIGPFDNKLDRECIRINHKANTGGCWEVGLYDWDHVGDIDGVVHGFEYGIDSPLELLNRFTRRDKTESEVLHLMYWIDVIQRMGFSAPDDNWLV